MAEQIEQAARTAGRTFNISLAELAGANAGQRNDLLALNQAVYRVPDGTLYTSDGAQLVPAQGLPVTASTNPLTGGIELLAEGQSYSLCKTFASGIPFVMPSSGTISNTAGTIMVATGFDYIIGPSYAFFPVGALFAASPSGWYYTNWTSSTIGVVYADTYMNATPIIPSAPAPLTTVAGPYTQAIGADVMGPTIVIPADFLGANGFVEWNRVVNNNNSAGTKYYNSYLGATVFQGLSQTTNPREAGTGTIKNRGRKTAQIAANAAHGDNNNASAVVKLSIDTSQYQLLGMSIRLDSATDYAMIESFFVRINMVA